MGIERVEEMLFVEQKVNLNFLPNPKHEVPV